MRFFPWNLPRVSRHRTDGKFLGLCRTELNTELSPVPPPVISNELTSTTPVMAFAQLQLAEPLARAVADMGYTSMTPIQAQAIPVVLQGRDVMGAAQTGTGKTAAFALPLLQRMMAHENASASPARHPVRALVLLPTRELAVQVCLLYTSKLA